MKFKVAEKYIVVVLFVMVLVVFTFAQRDSQRMEQLYQPYQTYQPSLKPHLAIELKAKNDGAQAQIKGQ